MSEKYYRNNREKCIASARKWQAENTEKEKVRKQRYYSEHRDELRDKNNEYNKVNRERVRANKRKHARRRAFWKLCAGANGRYKDRLVPFDLWRIAHRQKLICPLTGEKLTRDNISIDHIVPHSEGGRNIPSNVRLTTRDINWFKRAMNDMELYRLCRRVVNHMEKR